MQNGIIIRDDSVWHGHPDVAFFNNTLYVVYRESDKHLTKSTTRIKITKCFLTKDAKFSDIWTEPITIDESENRYNCPRLSVVNDNLILICDKVERTNDYIAAENDESKTSVHLWISNDGENWSKINTTITGIVPDRITKIGDKYCIATHTKILPPTIATSQEITNNSNNIQKIILAIQGRLSINLWIANNYNDEQWEKIPLFINDKYNYCESSISPFQDKYICLIRENSGLGLPAFYSISKDGINWNNPQQTRLFGCHRPVGGVLRSGKFLTTYREQVSSFRRGYWAKNTFACLTSSESILDGMINSIILPLDHDNSHHSDSGYTGWVQLPDNSIFIVNYITKDAPKPYIKWYIINETDF